MRKSQGATGYPVFPKNKGRPRFIPVSRQRAALFKTRYRRDESRLRMRAYTESAPPWQEPSERKLRAGEMTARKFLKDNLPSPKKARLLF